MFKAFVFIVISLAYKRDDFANAQCSSITKGGYLAQSVNISFFEGPCSIYNDLFVPEKITLTLEAGSELRFAPGVMLAVNGTLIARGQPDRRIVLTKLDPTTSAPVWPNDIKLVDDFSVSLGRLQLLHKNRWRGVCANNVNWTQADADVACRQLGFRTGNFSFGTWARNDESYLLFYTPSCRGNESSLIQCPRYNQIKIGTNICKAQQTVYLKCYGISQTTTNDNNNNNISDYWWGLEFYNSSYVPTQVGNVETNDSTSVIRHVDITFAGVTKQLGRVPALRADPTAPSLVGVFIGHSALDAVNFTNLLSPTVVRNVTISNSRGHGMNVESLIGRVNVTDSIFTGNYGNGFKVKFLDRRFQILDKDMTFCSQPNVPNKFPQIITAIPGLGDSCGRKFTTYNGLRLTLNILEMDIEPAASAFIDVYDGYNDSRNRIGSYRVVNGSLPMGVTTTFNYAFVKFNWSKLPDVCPSLRFCVKVTMIVDTYKDSMPELYMNNTTASNNSQHGLFIENVRNYVMINSSRVVYNSYGAGIRIFGGAGDVLINSSAVEHNRDSGVNITYDGGWRIFNLTSFSHNFGPGINVTFNETSVDNFTRYARIQQTHVSRSAFVGNAGYGIQVGNYCLPGNAVVVNDSYFSYNSMAAVRLFSCFRAVPFDNASNFTVAYNTFESNREHAVKISPLVNAFGRISNNTFTNHSKYVLLLDNTDDFLHNQFFLPLVTDYQVWGNSFVGNYGHYVANFRLTEGSRAQNMSVMYNVFRDNRLGFASGSGSSDLLNFRYRVGATVFLSSSNIVLSRNHLENPLSPYEVATQLDEMNVVLDASKQWWSTTNYEYIITRIFDQYSRFNLARISYHPALDSDWLWTPVLTDRSVPVEVKFLRGDKIGGRLVQDATLKSGRTYDVDRDVSVLAGGRLFVEPGVKLHFSNCLSMSVEGYAKFVGTRDRPIVFGPATNESTWINSSLIRLVDGVGVLSGRLQIRPSEEVEWGTVCREGWSFQDSVVACNQMGLVADPEGWQFMPPQGVDPATSGLPIYRSYVQCDLFDTALHDCLADFEDDHSCDHTMDVYLRCKYPAWGGIRFLGTAVPSVLDNVVVFGGGRDDPASGATVPALRIDYNLHSLSNLVVRDNAGDGVVIYHNDALANSKLVGSVVSGNGRNGVSVRSSYFGLEDCLLEGNGKNGFDFNPSLTTEEALLLRSGVTRDTQVFLFDSANGSIKINREEDVRWILTPRKVFPKNSILDLEIQVNSFYKVVLDVIDYNPIDGQEQVRVYEGPRSSIRDTTFYWSLENDTIDFPIVSQLNYVTIRWFVANASSGRLTFFARSKHYDWKWPFPVLYARNVSFVGNGKGFSVNQYNQPTNEFYDLFTRYQWTKIYVTESTFESNKREAIYVASISRYNVLYMPDYKVLEETTRVAEIEFQIEGCTFRKNGLGIVSEHLNVEYSSNVWVWNLDGNLFEENQGGGISLYLPRVNLLDLVLFNHSVNVNATTFRRNNNTEFRIDGFYCNSTIANNVFENNWCRPGCLSMAGTEKDFEVVDNRFEGNRVARYVVELNMNSHTAYTQWVDALVSNNIIQRNNRLDPTRRGIVSSPLTYAFGVLGVQNVTINRNLFGFNDLDVEFLAGQTSSDLENYLDVTMNYWGTTDQLEIRKSIFDFDDWNSFSIAEYHPFLLGNSFDSPQYVGKKERPMLDLSKPIGGRVSENLILKKRSDPYVVVSDLTVMPGSQLVIESGVRMLFYPNVGILSLGSLSAIGSWDDRITFGPVELESNASVPGQFSPRKAINHPDVSEAAGYQIRLRDGKLNDQQGFVEIYNDTEKRWSLVCDDGFTERTAEVFCRYMGFEASNPVVYRSPYYDIFVLGYPKMHEQLIEWYWRESFICDGREAGPEECRRRINYALPECMASRRYVFMRCGPRNLPSRLDYWGSIRFNLPDYESGRMTNDFIRMEQVDVYAAGRLHGKRSAAVEGIFRTPGMSRVSVQNCLWNAVDYVAAIDRFSLTDSVIQNNNGYAIGVASFNGQSTESVESTFVPLVQNRVPYDAYGFIRMCTVEKLVKVTDRSLLYFKYDFETVDCVKIIRSRQPRKRIGIRFLQVNLFNDTMYENAIEMFNSEFLRESLLIGRINPESPLRDLKRFYVSGAAHDTVTVRMKASPGYRDYGFVAEVVTIPISGLWRPNIGANQIQLISKNLISRNEGGGIFFHNVGENNMRLSMESNYITRCGLRLLNITMPGAMDVYIQNTKLMTIANNYIDDNAGGIFINTTTSDNQVAIYANITNNVLLRNTHCHAFYIEGHRFQGFDVRYNYIAYNDVEYRNIFSAFGVQLNFSNNIVYNNTGQCIMNASVEELVSITQQYTSNAIYQNWASSFNRSTFFLKSAQFKISNNFLLNPYNVYEISMFNRTKYMNDEKGLYPSVVATNNWWGGGQKAYVAGRIWDRRDDDNLIQVDYEPFYKDNTSVLEGKCYPGWKLYGSKCYWYFGGAVPYTVADKTCRDNRARLAWARNPTGRETGIGEVISQFQFNYDAAWQTWIYSEQMSGPSRCPLLQNYVVTRVDCHLLLPFICEKSPFIVTYMNPVPIILAAVISGCILLLVVAPLVILAIIKSFQRKDEKSERTELLRESNRTSRRSNLSCITDNHIEGSSHYRKQSALTPNQFINISGVTLEDSSTDFNSKVKIPSSSSPSSIPSRASMKLKSSRQNGDTDSSSALAAKLDDANWRRRNGVDNEISILSPRRLQQQQQQQPQQRQQERRRQQEHRDFDYGRPIRTNNGSVNYAFDEETPGASIPPPYRSDSSSNGRMTGAPDLGLPWVSRTTRQGSSSTGNGMKSPSVTFSPNLQAPPQTSSSDEKRHKRPRPPLDSIFV